MPIPEHISKNIALPVIGAPLFLISVPELVIAQCKAGIIGSFPALNAHLKRFSRSGLFKSKVNWLNIKQQILIRK